MIQLQTQGDRKPTHNELK